MHGNIPRYAIYRGRKVRVLQYLGDDYFEVLSTADVRYRTKRENLTFIRSPKRK